MSPADLHPWNLSPEAAIQVQAELRSRLVMRWDDRQVSTIGGVAVRAEENHARAAIVVLGYPDLIPIEASTVEASLIFPYFPGLLAYREGPIILWAWERLCQKPDLLLLSGQGIAHPRGIGIASQMGLWLEHPTIGVAKSRLYGIHTVPGPERGDRAHLYDEQDRNRHIGEVLRTCENVNPLYISPGHLIDIDHCVAFIMDCVTQFRFPEPIRWAHRVIRGEKLPSEPGNSGAVTP